MLQLATAAGPPTISNLGTDLYDPLDTKDCRRKVNELGLNSRDCHNCLLSTLPYDWTTGQKDYMASYKDSREQVICKRHVTIYIQMEIRNVLAPTNIEAQGFRPGHIFP